MLPEGTQQERCLCTPPKGFALRNPVFCTLRVQSENNLDMQP